MIKTGCFRSGKKIGPRPRKQLKKPKDVRRGPSVPTTLQLNIEGITVNKICVLSQLATKHNFLFILLQETHYINADRLVIPNFSLASSVLSRKHGLVAFVHERLNWKSTKAQQCTNGVWLSHRHASVEKTSRPSNNILLHLLPSEWGSRSSIGCDAGKLAEHMPSYLIRASQRKIEPIRRLLIFCQSLLLNPVS